MSASMARPTTTSSRKSSYVFGAPGPVTMCNAHGCCSNDSGSNDTLIGLVLSSVQLSSFSGIRTRSLSRHAGGSDFSVICYLGAMFAKHRRSRVLGEGLLEQLRDRIVKLGDRRIVERIDALPRHNLNEFGVDPFGYDPEAVKLIAPLMMFLKEHWFRCEVHNIENVPGDGRFLLIGNHSGQLPFDAAMVTTTVLADAPRPRLVRSMVERWSAELPFVSSLFVRTGQVVGEPTTCARLLEAEEGVLVFPEGARGINKLFSQRYQLASFGHGFMRLAMQ